MSRVRDATEALQNLLHASSSKTLEDLVGELLGQLVGVVFSRARGGSQHGGDGGVQGDHRRHLIFEAKRYRVGTQFNDREIRGEIDEAVERNPDLEAWILVSTRDVPEQTVTAMRAAARPRGIEALVIDWLPSRLPRLAALCASAPDTVEDVLGQESRRLLVDIRSSEHYDELIQSITASLRDTVIGFELLRRLSHARVNEIWSSRYLAESRFGQNVAAGDLGQAHVERIGPNAELDSWRLQFSSNPGNAALIVGREGMGKTWAAVHWLQSRLNELPIVVLAPSLVLGAPHEGSSTLISLMARCMRDLDQLAERDERYWEARVRRLLRRPIEEGPVFILFFDGMNEQPSYQWKFALNLLQDEPLCQRVRVLASVRNSFIEEQLGNLVGWIAQPVRIEVGPYDDKPGGEFDQRLQAAGMSRNDMPDSLKELARVPRLFDLVIRLKDRLGGVERVTVHRLIWEHGATALRTSAFTPSDWLVFVRGLAEDFIHGQVRHTRKRVTELSSDSGTSVDTVIQRLSQIVDGAFAQTGDWGDIEFEADFVRHALGLVLVYELESQNDLESRETLERVFEPWSEHDEAAEIFKASVSITLASDVANTRPILNELCTRWVRCQNLPDAHLDELSRLAVELVEPLLHAVEETRGHVASSSRYRAVNALNKVDHNDANVARKIAESGARWLARISQARPTGSDEVETEMFLRTKQRLQERIGNSDGGYVNVLGRELEIVPQTDEGLSVVAAQLLQGRPLAGCIEYFVAEALNLAISGSRGDEQAWLNVVNDTDPGETAERLRESSERILLCQREDGVHNQLNERVAAILLWRTGYPEDALRARQIDPGLDPVFSYAKDYEIDPAKSFYELERRHVDDAIIRNELPLTRRIQRTLEHLMDPSLSIPDSFVDEIVSEVQNFNWDNVNVGMTRTIDDRTWRNLMLVLARCAPDELARIERERICEFAKREGEARYGAALTAPD